MGIYRSYAVVHHDAQPAGKPLHTVAGEGLPYVQGTKQDESGDDRDEVEIHPGEDDQDPGDLVDHDFGSVVSENRFCPARHPDPKDEEAQGGQQVIYKWQAKQTRQHPDQAKTQHAAGGCRARGACSRRNIRSTAV